MWVNNRDLLLPNLLDPTILRVSNLRWWAKLFWSPIRRCSCFILIGLLLLVKEVPLAETMLQLSGTLCAEDEVSWFLSTPEYVGWLRRSIFSCICCVEQQPVTRTPFTTTWFVVVVCTELHHRIVVVVIFCSAFIVIFFHPTNNICSVVLLLLPNGF